MATGIRRSLFIGLGGTGISSLLYTKEIFIDTYGEVPPVIGFLGIDIDEYALHGKLLSAKGETVELADSERLLLDVSDIKNRYKECPEDFSWIPEENQSVLNNIKHGAGQVRSNGRFALTLNESQVADKIQQMLLQITAAKHINNEKYFSLNMDVEIHMVFSLSGGTGSGTFVNIASHIRTTYPNYKLIGYAVLPGIFDAMIQAPAAKANIYPNAYGAIKEIDYTMHMDYNTTPITLKYINGAETSIGGRLFNSITLIDNVNQQGLVYNNIYELTEMIGLALFTDATKNMPVNISDAMDQIYASGVFDVKDKKAWIGGLGICEIIYKGKDLARIYQIKATKNIIERLGNSCEDTDNIVNAWIDSPEVNIRENDGNDHVIDFILDATPTYELTITDKEEPENEARATIQQNKAQDADLANKVNELTKRIRTGLTDLIVKHINKECGISTVKNIILGITAQVEIFKGEMQNELEEFRTKKPTLDSELDAAIADLKTYMRRPFIFRTSAETEARCNAVVEATGKICINENEIVRRQEAIKVFNATLSMLLDENNKVDSIKETLGKVNTLITSELANITNHIGRNIQTFQIDLASEEAKNIKVIPEEIQIQEFARSIGGDAIYSLYGQDAAIVLNKFTAYTSALPSSIKLGNTTIDDVIDKMSTELLEAIMSKAIKKSSPLLDIDYGGYIPRMRFQDFYYVGVPNMNTSRLFREETIKNITQGIVSIDHASTGVYDKIIIYRQLGVIPAYALSCLGKCRNEYDISRINHQVDAHWETRMIRDDFDINPQRTDRNEDLLGFWVKGFIFGLIKNEDGEYKLKSQELGDPLFDSMVSLGHYRDDAYTQFKQYKATIVREFTEYFDYYASSRGEDAVNKLVADVKANYFDNYSQIYMTRNEIASRGNESIRRLISQEIEYVIRL